MSDLWGMLRPVGPVSISCTDPQFATLDDPPGWGYTGGPDPSGPPNLAVQRVVHAGSEGHASEADTPLMTVFVTRTEENVETGLPSLARLTRDGIVNFGDDNQFGEFATGAHGYLVRFQSTLGREETERALNALVVAPA